MLKTAKQKRDKAKRRQIRVRAALHGTAERPRLSVFRSSKHISAQIINDDEGKTIVSTSDTKIEDKGKAGIEVAALVGTELGKLAISAGVKKVIFDRGSYKYHGRVKALADAARKGGLEF